VLLYKLTSIIIIPLVRRSGSLRISLAFPAICPRSVYVIFRLPALRGMLRMHDCALSVQSFAALNDIRMQASPMHAVTLRGVASLSPSAPFSLPPPSSSCFLCAFTRSRAAAIFFHAVPESHYPARLPGLESVTNLGKRVWHYPVRRKLKSATRKGPRFPLEFIPSCPYLLFIPAP